MNCASLEPLDVNGRVVGRINWEKRLYISERNWGRHYFRIHKGFGMSDSILAALKSKRIPRILLTVKITRGDELEDGTIATENGERILRTTVDDFIEKGIHWADETHTRRWTEKQRILPVEDFK